MLDFLNQLSLSVFQDSELLLLLLKCLAAVLLILGLAPLLKDPPVPEIETPELPHLAFLRPSKQRLHFSRHDIVFVLSVTLIYMIVSFHLLGSHIMPITTWQPSSSPQSFILHLKEETSFQRIVVFYGEGDNNSREYGYQIGLHNLTIDGSNDLTSWEPVAVIRKGSIYRYLTYFGYYDYRYLRVTSSDDRDTITEISLFNYDRLVPLEIYQDDGASSKYPASLVIDEQELIPSDPTYYDESYFDEIYHPRNAWEIAEGQNMYATVHPLLGTELMALSIKLLGNHPLAWRLPGAIIGVLMIPLFYLLLRRLFNHYKAAELGTVFLACGFMHITTSRIATLEPISVFLIMLMFERMVNYCDTSWWDTPFRTSLLRLAGCGFAMSLALSSKWTACFSAVGLAILFFSELYRRYLEYKEAASLSRETIQELSPQEKTALDACMQYPAFTLKTILAAFGLFVFLPAVIYVLVYLPARFSTDGWSVSSVIRQTLHIYNYHKNLEAIHPYQSTWKQWVLDKRPIWYYGHTDRAGVYHTITCLTHPLLTWTGLLTVPLTALDLFRKRSFTALVITVGFFTALIPWMGVERCVFAYHYYPSSIFLALSIVYCADALCREFPDAESAVYVYLFLVLAVFVVFLPVLTGFGTSKTFVDYLEFIDSWQLG